jgi:hypothetical protein
MEWVHKCSLSWLKRRQSCLTASDVKQLVPYTATGRPRKITNETYLRVMAHKMVDLTEEDCISYGAAARGHLLEPLAVDALNTVEHHETYYHWDDKIIIRGELGFSPDAMTIEQTDDIAKIMTEPKLGIAEIKCYSDEKHLVTAYTDKKSLEERWQIATAMTVLTNIDHAKLVLFNPRMKFRKLFIIDYDRSELQDEIDVVNKIAADWHDFKISGFLSKKHIGWNSVGGSEESIAKRLKLRPTLNP